MVALLIWAIGLPGFARQAIPLPRHAKGVRSEPTASERKNALDLFKLASHENPSLQWNDCLAAQAFMRARQIKIRGGFEHENRKTGKNSPWNMIDLCIPAGVPWSAGENLAKGFRTPRNIHRAFMKSPAHRENIMNPRFNHLGVGCYKDVCVEFFAGF